MKTVFSISYDLNSPGQDYDDLYEEIKKLGEWCHPLDSTWFVDSSFSAKEVRDKLESVMDNSDALIVVKASAPGAWFGLSDKLNVWLRNHL